MNVTILSYDLGARAFGRAPSGVTLPHRGGFVAEALNRAKNIHAPEYRDALAERDRRGTWQAFDRRGGTFRD